MHIIKTDVLDGNYADRNGNVQRTLLIRENNMQQSGDEKVQINN